MPLKYKNTRNTNYTIENQLVNRIMPCNGLKEWQFEGVGVDGPVHIEADFLIT